MTRPLSTFDIAGRAMGAQLVRLNAIASNLANAGSLAGTSDSAYRALRPVFATQYAGATATVNVAAILKTGSPEQRHAPDHPLADREGNVWASAVDSNQELVEMMEAARQYSNNVEVLATSRSLALETLRLGR